MGRRRETEKEKIDKYVVIDDDTGCWNWSGKLNQDGYGRLTINRSDERKDWLAHRFVYTFYRGDIEGEMTLDHICRNRRCVNPDHLEEVTIGVNLLRGNTFQAANKKKTHCKRGHPLSGDNLYKNSGRRHCRECRKIASKKT